MSDSTLYKRLGGEEAIAAVVDAFYERVLADDRVAGFFEETDMQSQRAHQTQFLSAVAGGPVEYTGEEMDDAHEGMGIQQEHFDAIAENLEAALREFDVDEPDRTAVLEAVASYEDDIVEN